MTLDELLPHLDGVTTGMDLCKRILDLGVPQKLKFKLACAARDALGFSWTDPYVREKLKPGAHTLERVEKHRATMAAYRATPEGGEKVRAASRKSSAAIRATPRGEQQPTQRLAPPGLPTFRQVDVTRPTRTST